MYYVSPDGNDTNPGTIDKPWRTLSPVHTRKFIAGDVIHFRSGGSWSGGLVINDSGVEGNPIIFTAYGTGEKPIITNPGEWTSVITIDADWLIVEGIMIREAHEAGVLISTGSNNNVVRDCEITGVGHGIQVFSQHNHITDNYIHDLHMIVNTESGNDDYGAVCVVLFNSNNEVSYNKLENCIASSFDYGVDGGAVELYGIESNDFIVDNNNIHHNWIKGCDGIFEIGSELPGSAKNNIVAYNVSINNGLVGVLHLGSTYESNIKNFRFENNTVVEIAGGWRILSFWGGSPKRNSFLMRNNIFYIDGFKVIANETNFSHDHNLFYLINTELGFTLGDGEMIDDPLFVNISGEDFHLQHISPAINGGIDLGYSIDYDDRPVPIGHSPDIGAFEHQ
jgi:hypothetical protein